MSGRRASVAVALAGALLVGWGAHLHLARTYVIVSPGPAEKLSEMVKVEGGSRDAKGAFLLTAVTSGPAGLLSLVNAAVSPVVDLVPRSREIPPGLDSRKYLKIMESLMRESEVIAGAVALRKMGIEVVVETAVRVEEVLRESPSEGLLREGDVILAVDGKPVKTADEAVRRIGARKPGTPVDLTVRRDGQVEELTIRTVPHPENRARAAVGILVSASITQDLPLAITINPREIKGSSAGLMFALEILDQLDPRDLTSGHVIAGTGTIDLAGVVGPVGGVKQKVAAAMRAGAQYFLVPFENLEEAKAAATSLKVIAVDDVDDALRALEEIAGRGNGASGE